MNNNKKGFTLIELLAVIVILAILVMLAIPAVTRYLNSARRNAFADNALRAIEAVRNDVIENGFSSTSNIGTRPAGVSCSGGICVYTQTQINELLEKKLNTSAYGEEYKCVVVWADQNRQTYTMTMIDNGGSGFKYVTEDKINSSQDVIKTNDSTLKALTADECKTDKTSSVATSGGSGSGAEQTQPNP